MPDIPSEIVADFLSRVPVQSLLRFRCFSKSWRAIIDSPEFIKIHLNRTIQTNSDRKLILCPCQHCGVRFTKPGLHMADFDAVEVTNKAAKYLELDHPLKLPKIVTVILGSCHGLLCLENSEKDIVLWNPTTRKHFKLPSLDFELLKESICGYGFGYDKVSDDYKVLILLQAYDFDSEVKVFSMKSKCWRKLPCFPCRLKSLRAKAVLARGALHWDVYCYRNSRMENLIAAFDLGTEEYRLLPLPDDLKKERQMNVAVLGESLCMVCRYFDSVDIWVMKEYAVKESWTKLFTVTELEFETKPFYYMTPVAYSRSGHQVYMVQNDYLPLWYDLRNRQIRYPMFSISNMMEYHMSFGSLVQTDGGISDSVGYAKGRETGKGSLVQIDGGISETMKKDAKTVLGVALCVFCLLICLLPVDTASCLRASCRALML